MKNKEYYEEYYSIKEEVINCYKVKVRSKYENLEEYIRDVGFIELFKNSEFFEANDIISSDLTTIATDSGDLDTDLIKEAMSKDK